jgi:hypothetical protein
MTATTANHRMKQLLLACCLGAAVAAAQAHPLRDGHAPRDPAQRVTRMQDSLQLSEAQTKQIKGIFETSAQQRKTLEQKYKIAEREAFAAELKTLREQTRAKIDGVLTAPQKKARDAQRLSQQHKHNHKLGHKHGYRGHKSHCGTDTHRDAAPAQPAAN